MLFAYVIQTVQFFSSVNYMPARQLCAALSHNGSTGLVSARSSCFVALSLTFEFSLTTRCHTSLLAKTHWRLLPTLSVLTVSVRTWVSVWVAYASQRMVARVKHSNKQQREQSKKCVMKEFIISSEYEKWRTANASASTSASASAVNQSQRTAPLNVNAYVCLCVYVCMCRLLFPKMFNVKI